MKYFLLLLVLLPQTVFSENVDTDTFYQIYKAVEAEDSFDNVQAFYSKSYLNELRSDLKSKCGLACIFGLNDEWERKYRNILLANDVKYIKEYRAVKVDGEVRLTVVKTSCHSYGDIYEAIFVYEDGKWKIDRENISINIETSISILDELKNSPGCIYVRHLGL